MFVEPCKWLLMLFSLFFVQLVNLCDFWLVAFHFWGAAHAEDFEAVFNKFDAFCHEAGLQFLRVQGFGSGDIQPSVSWRLLEATVQLLKWLDVSGTSQKKLDLHG